MSSGEIVTIVAAIGVVIVNVITALRVARVEGKADTIAHSVNSAASASTAKIEGLQKEVGLLHRELSDQREAAALLAQAAAAVAVVTVAKDLKPEGGE